MAAAEKSLENIFLMKTNNGGGMVFLILAFGRGGVASVHSPNSLLFLLFVLSAIEYTVVYVLGLLSWETAKARSVATRSMATRRLGCTYCSMGIRWSGILGVMDIRI